MKEYFEKQLQAKEEELARFKNSFKVMVDDEIDTGNFERNAISDLTLMLELKTEIKELKAFIQYKKTIELIENKS